MHSTQSRFGLLIQLVFVSLAVLHPALADQGSSSPGTKSDSQELKKWHALQLADSVRLYQWLHQNPEVSFEEKETASRLATEWKKDGFEVTEKLGGHGIVGLLRNGNGPVVMLRTDLDALPITERTGLPYSSTASTKTQDGVTVGVMHACGHDVHMTTISATGRFMSQHRDAWSGTLVLVGQPAEERGSGAKAMLNDGLFSRFPKPDFALALHCESSTPAGTVGVRSGFLLANVDSIDLTVKGRGGHGASPESTIDPIVQAAELVLSLQSIVSREIKPIDPAVVTVGAIHAGSKHNIISDECHLQLTVRSYSPEVRAAILAAIERRAKGVADAWGAPEPVISVSEGTPALENNRPLAERMTRVFQDAIGTQHVTEAEQVMGGEDFSQYGLAGVPILMYRLGVIAPERLERMKKQGIPIPSLHSAEFYPDLEGTLETAFLTMTAGALDLLQAR